MRQTLSIERSWTTTADRFKEFCGEVTKHSRYERKYKTSRAGRLAIFATKNKRVPSSAQQEPQSTMVKVKKNPKATAEGQQPEDDSADINDPDTDLQPEDDTEIDRQEESDSDVEMSEVDMMHQLFIWISFDKKDYRESLRSQIAELQDMNGLTEQDISDIEKSYAKRPGKIGGFSLEFNVPRRLSL